jgi:hypothetical protein
MDSATDQAMRDLQAAYAAGRLSIESFNATMSALRARIDAVNSRATALGQALNSSTASARQQGAAAANAAALLKKTAADMQASGRSADEIRREMEHLAHSIASQVSDPELKNSIKKYASSQVEAAETTARYKNAMDVASKVGGAMGSVFKEATSGSSQIGTSSVLFQNVVSGVGAGLSRFGEAATEAAAGMGILARTGWGVAAVAGLGLLGKVAEVAGRALSEAATKILPMLSSIIADNIAGFQGMSSSGALLSTGFDGMISAAGAAGVTLKQLDSIVKANKESLADLGQGVTGGMNKLVRVLSETADESKNITIPMAEGGKKLKKDLYNLGYTIEEQASLVAETMKNMRQSGKTLGTDPATVLKVQEETKKYAENLRIVTAITGEDARKKMAQIQAENNRLAIQQKLAEMTPDQRAKIKNAQLNMSDLQRQAFDEMLATGGNILSPELAATMAQMPNLQASVEEMYRASQEGTLDDNKVRQIQAERGEAMKQEMLSAQSLGLAGIAGVGGMAQKIAENMGKELEFRNRYVANIDELRDTELRVRGQENPPEGSAQDAMTGLLQADQNLRAGLSNFAGSSKVLTYYANLSAKAAEALKDTLEGVDDAFRGMLGRAPTQNTQQQGAAALANRQEESRLMSERAQLLRNMNEEERRQFEEIDRTGRGPNGEIPQSFFEQLARRQNVPVPTRSTPTIPSATTPPLATPPANMTPEQRAEWQRTHPGQQIPPATPAGATRAATPDMNSNEGQRAAAENFYNGRATALPNGPTPNETPEQRQAREQTPATTGNNGRQPRTVEEIRQERREDATAAAAPVVAEVQRLAALMTDVNRHLESIDRNINGVNTNTGTLVHLQ